MSRVCIVTNPSKHSNNHLLGKVEDFLSKHKATEREQSEATLMAGMEDVNMDEDSQGITPPSGIKYLDQLVSYILRVN